MNRNLIKIVVGLVILALVIGMGVPVLAGTLTTLKDKLNRLKASQTSGITHKVIFTTATAVSGGAGNNDVIIVAPDADDSTWCATAGTDGSATGCTDESSTALPGTLTSECTQGAGASSYDTITVQGVNDLSSATKYCVDISEGTNAKYGTPSAGSHTMTIKTNNGSSDVDTGEAVIQILSDDQVAISASVGASLSFTITDTTIGFGTLSTSAATYATGDTNGSASETSAHDLTASTNSTSGYTITVKGDTLTSGANTITAIGGTAADSSPGSEQFGINLVYSGGSGTATAPYNDQTSPYQFAYAATASTEDEVASSTGASATTTYSVYYLGNIASSTEAGDYSATLTYICTGQF